MNTLIVSLHTVAALYVLWHAICAGGTMTHRTDHWMRAATALLAIGTFGELVYIAAGHVPDWLEFIVILSLAVGAKANRRQSICPCLFMAQPRTPPHGQKTPPPATS